MYIYYIYGATYKYMYIYALTFKYIYNVYVYVVYNWK